MHTLILCTYLLCYNIS